MFEYEPADTPDGYTAETLPYLRARLCWKCPVRVECLADGMIGDDGMPELYGIRGGLTAEDRRKVMQLTCACGKPIDPKHMLTKVRSFCPDCRPILFDASSKV